MRLVRVRLRNFRGVTDATVEFSEQVTIVEGPNEVGKSSIAEALRLLRGTKAGSRHRDVVAVQPIGSDVGPEVEVELRSGAYDLVFRKRWLRSPLTELAVRAPRPEQLSGDAAHERFSALLAESVDLDLLDALEVVQGRSLDRPDLATITALHRALDSTAVADDHDDLLERIEEEYARYFTAGGKPTGNYRKVTDEIAGLESELAGYQGRSAELDWFVEDRARQAALREEYTVALAEAERELAGLEQQAKALDELRATVASAEGEFTTAEAALQQATDAQRSRRQLAEEVADRTRQLAELEGRAEGFAANHRQLSDDLQAARASAGQAGRHRDEARQVAQTATTAIEHHRLRAEHGEV
ncbi:MAG: AAA family ATPase, partial [Propionicimonas sp.]|nr:AAA family ATPase [Propionicimonas sp.]